MKATRDDVAARAGVSAATVSRVYNDPASVSPPRRERVLAAAAALSYVPDKNASALRRSGTGYITLLEQRGLTGVHGGLYRSFYHDMLRGVREVLDRSMYQLSIFAYDSPRDIERAAGGALGDGAILHGADDLRLIAALKRRGHPYVCCGQAEAPRGVNSCHTDNVLGGLDAARVFREAGHRRPAHITGSLARVGACQGRWQGFREGWGDTRILLIDGVLGAAGGRVSGRQLARAVRGGAVDCVFVVNDWTAIGVLQALLESGVRVPEEVSLIGYDHLPLPEMLPLRLATIDIAFGAVYARGTERLLSQIRTGEAVRERIQPVYVEGETVAPSRLKP